MQTILCAGCGNELDEHADGEPRQRCGSCGSTSREIFVDIDERIELHEQLGVELKRQGAKKFAVQDRSGDDYGIVRQKWLKKVRVIDRETDRYLERIWDPETGEIVYECDEPLSQHVGHGSAKPRRRPPTKC